MTERLALRQVMGTTRPSVDRRGLLFEWDGRLLRAFRDEPAELIERMLEAPWLPELFAAGLVEFRRADLELEGYSLVVEVARVPVVSYPGEWPVAMLREAGLAIARVGGALARRGLGLQDAHPWNVLFDGPRAVFVDLGSIEGSPAVSQPWIEEFRRHVILPLALQGTRLHGLGAAIQGVDRGWLSDQVARQRLRWLPLGYRRVKALRADPAGFYDALERYVARQPAVSAGAHRPGRAGDAPAAGSGAPSGDAQQRAVAEVLGSIPPGRLIDAGSGSGRYARLAAQQGHAVVAMDRDDGALARLFELARNERLAIVPLRMDLMYPTGSMSIGLNCTAAPERLRADTLLCLGPLLAGIGERGIPFETFAHVAELFAAERAVVEFLPADDPDIRGRPIASEPWFTMDAFVAAMAPFFHLAWECPSSPGNRRILVFERQPEA